jgi:hypothetical protein
MAKNYFLSDHKRHDQILVDILPISYHGRMPIFFPSLINRGFILHDWCVIKKLEFEVVESFDTNYLVVISQQVWIHEAFVSQKIHELDMR